MSFTLGQLNSRVRDRLGDGGTIWGTDEIQLQTQAAYQELAFALKVFWDWVYLENLPRGFNYTYPWEQEAAQRMGFDFGCANFTFEDERNSLDPRHNLGPANYTSPFEATDGHLAAIGASALPPATAEVPAEVISIERGTWDGSGLDGIRSALLQRMDSLFETRRGEVYGLAWEYDGVRTVRKVRVPAQVCDTVVVDGYWGIPRDVSSAVDGTVSGSWGIPRRLPGFQPIGPSIWGIPRRFFLDGKNVRVEVWREGRAMDAETDVCELPDRYAIYLSHFACWKLLGRPGPGQQPKLAEWYRARWLRSLKTLMDRISKREHDRTQIMGGQARPLMRRPLRPKLPWQYGSSWP